ncbi:hypothetical protein KSP40_PGU004214 [Platanthera guangdongensis]|uniref:Uncharacterized protein n=1 Tax=Platanthera guangdongensis TaxID=2320717 RepID=A0ABR2LSR5_9ASPA
MAFLFSHKLPLDSAFVDPAGEVACLLALDDEALDAARSHIAEIDATLTRKLDDIDGAPRSSYAERERECRAKADADKLPYNTVLKLNEMHEAYESLLKEAEVRLEMIYSSTSSGYDLAKHEEKEDDGDQLNEEVIAILQEASVNCVERVKISGQQLRHFISAGKAAKEVVRKGVFASKENREQRAGSRMRRAASKRAARIAVTLFKEEENASKNSKLKKSKANLKDCYEIKHRGALLLAEGVARVTMEGEC